MTSLRVVVCAVAILTAPVAAIGFEGTLKLRTVSVERDKLGTLTGGKAPDAEQTLAITTDTLLAAKDADPQVRESMVYISGSKVRMDAPLQKGKEGYAIIDTEKNMTWFVVPSEQRYIEWSEADAKAMGEKMVQIEKMMKERMGSLPPDQRAQVEAMLKNMKAPEGGAAKLSRRFEAKFGVPMNGHAAETYMSTMVLADALERAKSADRAKLRDALAQTRICGERNVLPYDCIQFDPSGQSPQGRLVMLQIQKGKFVTVWPPEVAAAKPVYPVPSWSKR